MNAYIESRLSREWNAAALEEIALSDPDFDVESFGRRPLHWMLSCNISGRMSGVVKILLDRGASVDKHDVLGNTPLMEAMTKHDFDLLIKYGADVTGARENADLCWVYEAGAPGWEKGWPRRTIAYAVLASPRLCEDLARTIIELTQ